MSPSLTTARDIPLLITSHSSSSERRITPSWTIANLKAKLEPITGIPPSSQILSLHTPGQAQEISIEAEDEDSVEIGQWSLAPYAELKVRSSGNEINFNAPTLSSVPKYEMPEDVYEKRPETVLAYKKAHKVGRFDPNAPEIQQRKAREAWEEVEQRNIKMAARCHLLAEPTRRGSIAYIGPIDELPGAPGAPWIGIILDEPTGKNDGSIKGKRYFQSERNRGVFVRPGFVQVGDFPELGLLADDEEL
ncbi:hypothetical protein ACLMJK_002059 [Lecanora helva]